MAARQLLNNPPPPHTSPSVAEQWRHNIDQLIVAAINTPPHRGRQPPSVAHSHTLTETHMLSAPTAPIVACEPLAAHALSSTHAPAPPRAPTASATMTDLQAELNCHRGGEDSRITIERQCERRRNLEGEFDSLAPAWEAPTVRAMRPLAPLGFREDAWRSLCISVWWSGRASFGPT
jgi:hypothetical protein